MADPDRLDRLRLAQREIVARLDYPRTPPYSVAPLSNQLRLVEKEIARLTADEDLDHGLPGPGAVRGGGRTRLRAVAAWAAYAGPTSPCQRVRGRRDEIFRSWHEAGFDLSPWPKSDEWAVLEEWVESNRARLIRCLEAEAER